MSSLISTYTLELRGLNADDLERLTLTALRTEIDSEGISIRELERRLDKGKNWLSNRLLGKVPLGIGGMYSVLHELGISPADFFSRVLPQNTVHNDDNQGLEVARDHVRRLMGE